MATTEKIRVYELIDVSSLVKNEELIRGVFFEILKVPQLRTGYEFSISPISGWINFANNNELYSTFRLKSLLPNDPKDAERHALNFIKHVNHFFADNTKFAKSGLPIPFPSVYLVDSTLIFQKNGYPNLDHWLVRFGMKLGTGTTSSEVYGAALEIRIGNNSNKDFSQIIGFSLRWTPLKRSFPDDQIPFVDDHQEEEVTHHNEHEEEELLIMYKLPGESIPQNFLAPYYVSPKGHHLEFTPAVKLYAITARIFEVNKETGKDLYPDVKGGSGDFIYEWAYWIQGDFNATVTTVDGDFVSLPIGVYNVALNIIDRKTAVFTQTQSTVYSLGSEELRYKPFFEEIIKGCMHPLATNYKPMANADDENDPCDFPALPSS
ncbi:MAG: hypothetical protein H0U95_05090 [Bacteroidetes bacterium]|nr:hypothetical protein [Bacteroidota bacterium]